MDICWGLVTLMMQFVDLFGQSVNQNVDGLKYCVTCLLKYGCILHAVGTYESVLSKEHLKGRALHSENLGISATCKKPSKINGPVN
jgi:hypothetical protein